MRGRIREACLRRLQTSHRGVSGSLEAAQAAFVAVHRPPLAARLRARRPPAGRDSPSYATLRQRRRVGLLDQPVNKIAVGHLLNVVLIFEQGAQRVAGGFAGEFGLAQGE